MVRVKSFTVQLRQPSLSGVGSASEQVAQAVEKILNDNRDALNLKIISIFQTPYTNYECMTILWQWEQSVNA